MTVKTFIAILHETGTPTSAGQPVTCPFQPDGTPKPTIDHGGVLYQLLETDSGPDVCEYGRDSRDL